MIRSIMTALMLTCAGWCAVPHAAAQSDVEIFFVEIRAAGDSFTMGDGVFGPGVSQAISYDFSISKFPITNSQFERFIADGGYSERSYWTANGWAWKGNTAYPAHWRNDRFNRAEQPVVGVSWYEAVAYCTWLSVRNGLTPACDPSGRVNIHAIGFRLPTETEWEYAAAKDSPGQAERIYPWGNTWDSRNLICSVAPAKASSTASVGSRSPHGDTPNGLADMSGNVWQWCSDNAQSDEALAGSARLDRYCFRSDSPTERMVLRGGSWYNNFPNGFRAAFRNLTAQPGSRHDVTGFRIVRLDERPE